MWIYAFTAAFAFTIGDILFRYYIKTNNKLLLVPAFIFANIGSIFIILLMKKKELAIALSIITAINLILLAILGYLLFHENLTTTQLIAIGLIIISLFLLS